MRLIVNNQKKQYDQVSLSIQELLDIEFSNRQNGLAVAIDNVVVPRSEWKKTTIIEHSDVLIISATQGG
jgi:sulfur carrier protein